MQLSSLIGHITYEGVQGSQNPEIADICYHSRSVKEGSLFVCIKGQKQDGHDYIAEAIKQGAVAIVVEEVVPNWKVPVIKVRDARAALATLSAVFFDYPASKIKMIGITGTKGKTTTAFFVAGILKEAGYHPGVIGTIWVDNGRDVFPAEHTTPESCDIQRILWQMVHNNCDCCIMEVSSQGIKMQRVEQIYFDIGVFLNIEPDHIGKGEHASFAEYLDCKRKLFRQCEIGVVNQDDSNVNRILYGHTCEVETFSINHPAEVMAADEHFFMEQGKLYSTFWLKQTKEDRKLPRQFELKIQLPGRFNIYNALAAVSVAMHFHITEEQIQTALWRQSIPGRCENVSPSEAYAVLIDYAHNEMSLKNLLETLRMFEPKRLVVLFGCGGNRSGLRRSKMGETAGLMADFTILTSDNPRWEEPDAIIDDIVKGIEDTGGKYLCITDRREAVYYALAHAKEGDLIALLGKGHEAYQEIAGIKYPMTDRKLVEDAVKRLQTDTNT